MTIAKMVMAGFFTLLLVSCVDKKRECRDNVEASNESLYCPLLMTYMSDLSSKDGKKRADAQQMIDPFTLLCLQYLLDSENCRKIPKWPPEFGYYG